MTEDLDPVLAYLKPAQAEPRTQKTVVTAMEALARAALPTPSPPSPSIPGPSAVRLPPMRMRMPSVSPPSHATPKPRPIMNYRPLAPAPPPTSAPEEPKHLTIFDLPAELRVEIYKLVLENVTVHILPLRANSSRNCPHALIRTSRQVRNEALPLIHSLCPIRANVTDFDFSGMLAWIQRIPSSQEANLCKNQNLRVMLCTTSTKPHRPQPAWEYSGAQAQAVVANDLRRRCKRMPEMGKRLELLRMLDAMRVVIPGPRGAS
ncbi:hypothetical protein LTS02_015532 [Friedmanniomyces endolithicus]|nr:hypothetical protein LTR94_011399 [Friedmanniomyces endolithicus]KAK0844877.1 hypothetical protein LTS02_015532 [Friedmanniomyces endolithicus]